MAKPLSRTGLLGVLGAGLLSMLSVIAHLSHAIVPTTTLDGVRVDGPEAPADDRDVRPEPVFRGNAKHRPDVLRASRIIPTHGTQEPLPLFPNRRDEEPSRANRGLPGLEFPKAFRGY